MVLRLIVLLMCLVVWRDVGGHLQGNGRELHCDSDNQQCESDRDHEDLDHDHDDDYGDDHYQDKSATMVHSIEELQQQEQQQPASTSSPPPSTTRTRVRKIEHLHPSPQEGERELLNNSHMHSHTHYVGVQHFHHTHPHKHRRVLIQRDSKRRDKLEGEGLTVIPSFASTRRESDTGAIVNHV